jgi:MoxR-like ATPase
MSENTITPTEFRQLGQQITTEIGKFIVGQSDVIEQVLTAVLVGGHILLEGVPGLGKTMLVRTLGQVLALQFARIQFTPDLMPADITGTEMLSETPSGRQFRFQPGAIFANLVLADEINRATPKTQSAMLEAMQEKRVTVSNQTYTLPDPFFVLATQNPLEMEGTYPLPEAQLDRFLFKVHVPMPSTSELVEILRRTTGESQPQPQPVANVTQLRAMSALARQVAVASHVSEYIARLVVASHPEHSTAPDLVREAVRFGASPRGAQALLLGAKVRALFAGRFNVAFEDVQAVAPAALRHRLILGFAAQSAGINSDQVISTLLEKIAR